MIDQKENAMATSRTSIGEFQTREKCESAISCLTRRYESEFWFNVTVGQCYHIEYGRRDGGDLWDEDTLRIDCFIFGWLAAKASAGCDR